MGSRGPDLPYAASLRAYGPPNCAIERERWARALQVSRRAVDLLLDNEVIDQHVDTYIWHRIFGYDLCQWHGPGPLVARYCGQSDLPRLRAAGVSGATWVITTNPWRSRRGRLRALLQNHAELRSQLGRPEANAQVVRSLSSYKAARKAGKHAAFIGIQGGQALSDPQSARVFPLRELLRVTLVHLTDSDLGHTSSPISVKRDAGLLPRGRELIAELQAASVLVDLSHASKRTFWDAIAECGPSQPMIVSHTGFSGITPHWRNLDDAQARAIADCGGVIGVLYHSPYVGGSPLGGRVHEVARHICHGIRLLGPSYITLGSDWDGLIATPLDMPTCLELPRLVEALLDLHVSENDITQVLGQSFLKLLARVRP